MTKNLLWLVWRWDEQVGTVGGRTEEEALENARKFFGEPPKWPNSFSHVTLGSVVESETEVRDDC